MSSGSSKVAPDVEGEGKKEETIGEQGQPDVNEASLGKESELLCLVAGGCQ